MADADSRVLLCSSLWLRIRLAAWQPVPLEASPGDWCFGQWQFLVIFVPRHASYRKISPVGRAIII